MRSEATRRGIYASLLVLTAAHLSCASAPATPEPHDSLGETPGHTVAASARAEPPPSRPDAAPPVSSTGVTLASAAIQTSAGQPSAKPPLPKGTVVLHVGDSFVHSGLTQQLRKHFEPLGVRYEVRAEQSTNSFDWAKRLPSAVASTQPDLVLVTLGGNEIGSKHLDAQAKAVRRIVEAIGDRPCVWMTPPLWMEELGLFDMLQDNVGPCRFFETDRVIGTFIPRRKDKIHPTAEGGAIWADKLHAWLMQERVGDEERPWKLGPPTSDETTKRGRRQPLKALPDLKKSPAQ